MERVEGSMSRCFVLSRSSRLDCELVVGGLWLMLSAVLPSVASYSSHAFQSALRAAYHAKQLSHCRLGRWRGEEIRDKTLVLAPEWCRAVAGSTGFRKSLGAATCHRKLPC